jgi:hypothetical protein
LPDLAVLRSARYLSWALVLAALVMLMGQRWPRSLRRGLAVVALVWTLVPGQVSPAFWLGLAFQMPSLMSTLIATVVLVLLWQDKAAQLTVLAQDRFLQRAAQGGVVLGWLLLLDTFAVLPLSLYSIGFSPLALGVCSLLAVLPWMFWGNKLGARNVSLLLSLVLTVHVLLRLPTGNVWDALIDPWLWVWLQLAWLLRGARYFSARWRASKATRA